MNEQVTRAMFALIRYVVCGAELTEEDKAKITPELLPRLYALSKSHDMAHIVAQGLSNLGLLGEDEISQKFQKQQMLAVYRYQKLNYELEQICQTLEDAKIPFIPLKGSVIRQYYPEPWMRTSCDIDVLVHEEELETAIDALTQTLQYKSEGRGSHDISLFADNGVHLELHYDLIEEVRYPTVVKLLTKVWEYVELKDNSKYQYQLKDEMFCFYHTAHMAKHFENGGCGVRSVLDQWILDHWVSHNQNRRDALLTEGGLKRFDIAVRNLSENWFSANQGDSLVDEMSAYIITGGIYGNTENGVAIKRSKNHGKIKYILSRLFISYDIIKMQYPILNKHKWLTPVMEIRRWFRLLRKGRMKSSLHELNVNRTMSQEQIAGTADLLQKLGLD